MAIRIQIRRDSLENWTSENPVLAQGEIGWVIDTNKYKIGNGTSTWSQLSYITLDTSFSNITGDPTDNANLAAALNNKVTKNDDITGGTATKITYDAKGLVTAGTTLSASDIPSLTLSKISDVTASATEVNYIDGATSNIQTQINTVNDKIKEIELFKFPNATIIGAPTINNGQISGFSTANYLQFPFIVDVRNNPFEIDLCFITSNDITTRQSVTDSKFGLAFGIENGKGYMSLSSTGESWDIGTLTGTLDLQTNTTYYAKIIWDGSKYTSKLSTNGIDYAEDMSIESTLGLYPTTIYIGGGNATELGREVTPFGGTLNFNKCYLYVAGLLVWQGMDDAGLATRADISLSNLDSVGQAKFDAKVTANPTITGNTYPKITYDSKGLVTAGQNLTSDDIPSITLSKISDVTATATEVNVLKGMTATTTELNVLDGIDVSTTELNYIKGVTSAVQTQLNGKLAPGDVIDNLTSTTTNKPLSANMGKSLQDQVNNLKSIGKFLAIWNSITGLPTTNPETLPYAYHTGDYYRVGTADAKTDYTVYDSAKTYNTGDKASNNEKYYVCKEDGVTGDWDETKWTEHTIVNYKPNGTEYTGIASTTKETEDVEVGWVYYYDGTQWLAQSGGGGGKIQDVQVDGTSVVSSGTGVADITLSNFGITATNTELNYVDGVTSAIQTQLDGKVSDVQINSTSITSSGVANIPVASSSTLGVVETYDNYGITSGLNNLYIGIKKATDDDVKAKTSSYKPIVPANLDLAVKVGVTSNTNTLTTTEQTSARNWIGAGQSTVTFVDYSD